MENIKFNPIEERTLNDRLVNLYGSKLPELYAAVKPLFEDPNAVKPALPLLIDLYEDDKHQYPYETSDIKVMLFGHETNNWNDQEGRRELPNGTYNFSINTSQDVLNEICASEYGIADIYNAKLYKGRDDNDGKRTNKHADPFIRGMHQFVRLLEDAFPDKSIEFVWNNLYKIGNGKPSSGKCCGRPSMEIQQIETNYFNVIQAEIDILNPDIVIFMAGRSADERIKRLFNIQNNDFEDIDAELDVKRVNIPHVKYSARLPIHPSQPFISNKAKYASFPIVIEDLKNSFK